ncbi:MAG TPA: NAD(P)H-dependent oxidoreductase [Thermoguttaceae bacterium]|nr:NAD(P)H-dependent oxidoreductase [Thermoguttaceae bacterium]HPP53623.1 NAD(P)H-dependent oxidoreductase [Thermoguttaceae bacterium]
MKVLVLVANPNPGSFCHAIAQTAKEQLQSQGHQVTFHDLYAERFDPLLPVGEIPKDAPLDPVIQHHCQEVGQAEGFVVVHPNWWSMPPAILKGWIDRVFRQGVAYTFTKDGVQGFFQGRRAVVFTTSNTPRDIELSVFGDPLENLWKTCIFGFCGLENFYRRNFEPIIESTLQQRQAWLQEVRQIVRERFASG